MCSRIVVSSATCRIVASLHAQLSNTAWMPKPWPSSFWNSSAGSFGAWIKGPLRQSSARLDQNSPELDWRLLSWRSNRAYVIMPPARAVWFCRRIAQGAGDSKL